MAKFTLTPSIFSAEYSADFRSETDVFTDLQTDEGKFNGISYQIDSQITFCIAGENVKIWVNDIEEMTLGEITHYRGKTFTDNQELHSLVKAYSDVLMGLK